jgi:hypothetical protein
MTVDSKKAVPNIARGRTVRAVCLALGVSLSNVVAINVQRSEWTDSRRSPSRIDDIEVKQAIAHVVKDRAKYGY